MLYNSSIRHAVIRLADLITGSHLKHLLHKHEFNHNSKTFINCSDLNEILNHAIRTVPFYKKIDKFNDITEFPIINKNIIKENIDSFISSQYSKEKLFTGTTSGSTGSPFKFYYDKYKKRAKTIEVIYYNGWSNYRIGDRHLLNAVGVKKNKLKLFLQNEIITNPYFLNEKWLSEQREILKNNKILFYVGYASAVKEFSKYCYEKGDKPSMFKLKGVITGAEKLDEKTRQISEKVFGCPVLSRYSSLETGILAQECQEEHNFHINTTNYYIEILKIDSDEEADFGEVGRIVITDLRNYGMPLIRYDIGDLGVLSSKECKCGKKGLIFNSILGRTVENVTNPEGILVSWVVINDAMWKYPQIKHFQFIQKTKFSYLIKLETFYDKVIEDNIKNTYKDILGNKAKIDVEFVKFIPPLKSGKKPYIINESLNKTKNS